MAGGCQAQLVRADDGHAYVVKFANNPQLGRRGLVNEFVGAVLCRKLGLETPEPVLVEVDTTFLLNNTEACIALPNGIRREISRGVHFGSQFPGDPERVPVYDFLPDTLLPGVYNRRDFFGALVFDKWTANADGRQAIFYRALVRGEGKPAWIASLIDHGYALGGSAWSLGESDVQGIYARRIVYGGDPCMEDYRPWIKRLMRLEERIIEDICLTLPAEWIGGDEAAVRKVLVQLWKRRERVEDLVARAVDWLRLRRSRNPDRTAQRAGSHPGGALTIEGPA